MKIGKDWKILANLYIKKEYVMLIRNLKQALNDRLLLTKVHRVIKFNQKDWLKPCVDLNVELRKKIKNDFEKVRNMENVRKPKQKWII